ncbi:MAG TPA: hypothetical protein VLF17_00190 [Candidatus Nitrosotenuis sp.]|nr:hypothetical protein [Candidatus Nitrosotenuis sp.]
MGQFFTDDIDALIKSGHGDYGRLSRIRADFEAKKLVTIEDRKYVDGLIARYLPAAQTQKPEKTVKTPEKRIVPPPPPPINVTETKYQKTVVAKPIEKVHGRKRLRNTAIITASVVFAVLIIGAVAMNQGITLPEPAAAKNIETDQTSYVRGDIISISGSSGSNITRLAISDPDSQEVWTEIVKVRADGKFSTLVIAGGTGWEKAGKYTVTSSADGKTEKTVFDFDPSQSQ